MENWDYLFNDPVFKVKQTKVKLDENLDCYRFYCKEIDISDMFFIKIEDGTFEPYLYNVKKDYKGQYSGDRIIKGTIAYDFIQSIHYTETIYNSKKKKMEYQNLSILQWYLGVTLVTSAVKYEKKRWDVEVSRQFGKTHLITKIAGFLPVFAPLYADLINDRWWQILASYNDGSVTEIYSLKVKPLILKNIEFFNKLYPNEPLVFGRQTSAENLVNDQNKMEIRRMVNSNSEAHSYIVAISTNTIKDGKSCDWMWCDEAWRTNAKEFRRGILPFLGTTGGDLVVSGITTADTENLMYNIHFDEKTSTPFICNSFITYNFLKIDYPIRAKNLKLLAEEEFNNSGIDSNESQTNYCLTWDVLESGKFYTTDLMKKNRNFAQNDSLGVLDDIDSSYRVAGLDLATVQDYCVLTIWDVYKTEKTFIDELGRSQVKTTWKNQLRDVITYNLDRNVLSAEDIAKNVAKDCNTNKIDMIMIDGTAGQQSHNEWIYKEIKNLEINTLIVRYDFGGDKNKVILMANFEQMLRSGLVVLGSENELLTHRTFGMLHKEMVKLFKGYENGKKNIQYKAKGKNNTDDHVMSAALGCYCVPYVEYLQKKNEFISINSYRYRAKLTKFGNQKQAKDTETTSSWWQIPM